MLSVPNIPDVSVPEGNSDEQNKEIKVWGEIPKMDFKPKDHIELMEALDLADFESGTKVAGFRGYFLKNEGAELEFAHIRSRARCRLDEGRHLGPVAPVRGTGFSNDQGHAHPISARASKDRRGAISLR